MTDRQKLKEKINTLIATINSAHRAHSKEWESEMWRIVDTYILPEIHEMIDNLCYNQLTETQKGKHMTQKFIIIRGAPGSGKSTKAQQIINESEDPSKWVICEADQYFMVDGVYKFDPSKLGAAHRSCQAKVHQALTIGLNVIVANTNTTLKEVETYFAIAKENDVIPEVITLLTNYGNVHGVPEDKVKLMQERLEKSQNLIDLYDRFFPGYIK